VATTVSIRAIVDALEMPMDEHSSFVSKVTGEVRTVSDEELELASAEPDPDLPDWQRDAILAAREIMQSSGDWLELRSKVEIDEWRMLDGFAESLSSAAVRLEIRDCIRGKGAFRNFKAAVRRHGVEQDWYAYKAQSLAEIARDWLTENDLAADPNHGIDKEG
jgi:hypothetical protein